MKTLALIAFAGFGFAAVMEPPIDWIGRGAAAVACGVSVLTLVFNRGDKTNDKADQLKADLLDERFGGVNRQLNEHRDAIKRIHERLDEMPCKDDFNNAIEQISAAVRGQRK